MLAHEEGIPVEAELGRLSGSEVCPYQRLNLALGHIDIGWIGGRGESGQND